MIVDGGNFVFKDNPRYPSFNQPDESYHGLVYADLPAAQFATKCRAQMMRDMGAMMSPQNAFLSWLGCDNARPAHGKTFFQRAEGGGISCGASEDRLGLARVFAGKQVP